MRLAYLYLRSRQIDMALAAIALSVPTAIAWEYWLGHEPDVMTLALILLPLSIACIIGTTLHSPFGETEQTASLSLPLVRSIHIACLIALGGMALLLVALHWSVPDDGGTLARNLAGLAGLALLTSPLVGGRLSWVAPVTLALLASTMSLTEATPWLIVTWPQAAFDNGRALVAALVLLITGLAAVYLRGPRVMRDDALE